jgi:hypothetical protein
MNIPKDFSKKELRFWSWLTESYVLPDPLEFTPSKKVTKYQLVTTEEIRQLIADAFDQGNTQLADNLLEIASKREIPSDELVRKSIRLKTGEYLKLLYIKLLEETSFSEAIIKILMPYSRNYLDSFSRKYHEYITQHQDRINHLYKLIDKWDEMSPESRQRAVDMGIQDFEGTKDIPIDYPYKLEEVKNYLPDFFLGELDRKFHFRDSTFNIPITEVHAEFEKRWRNELDEYPLGNMILNVTINEQDKNQLLFKPTVRLSRHLYYDELMKLSEEYGERSVVGYINMFKKYDGEKQEDYLNPFELDEYDHIFFGTDIDLPSCQVTIRDAENYEIDFIEQTDYSENLYKDHYVLDRMVESLCKKIGIDHANPLEKDKKQLQKNLEKGRNELFSLHQYMRSDTWNNFLKLATRLAEPEDFQSIRKISTYRNQILNYFKVENLIYNLVDSSINRRSVVSFYVNTDVWRFLPLVLKEQDWFNIAELYLASSEQENRNIEHTVENGKT